MEVRRGQGSSGDQGSRDQHDQGSSTIRSMIRGQVLHSNNLSIVFTHGKTAANRVNRWAISRHLSGRRA